ncbi:ASC-1 homology domain protein [Mycolicibacterium canariasense]|uniref:ASC-1 homology domain protein n=1 Tax=Mycolicibacterium canariasense TaxID=228230 RepID=A0A100WDN2_MYCCR|nr:DUF3850 domain-containing protein [Mycolicibacterium canariasense]GAS96637.1 ASC-1 homology domain protein [Mycolicibacterium canariasense]
MTVRTHDLKSWSRFFRPIIAGERAHELRRNDRDYRVGDRVLLREYDPSSQTYTGSFCEAVVTSITSRDVPCAVSDQGLNPDFCILSVRVLSVSPDLREISGSLHAAT